MDFVGIALLGTAALMGVVVAWRPDVRVARLAMVVAWWLATIYLVTRFIALDLGLAEVVGYSRAELPAWLRGTGAWAGPAGSLLLWISMMVSAVTLATVRPPRPPRPPRPHQPVLGPDGAQAAKDRSELGLAGGQWAVRLPGAVSVVGAAVLVLFANPFRLAAIVPVNGRGLSPVLEHPAMAVHPPLLYLAQASVIYAALRATLGSRDERGQWVGRAPVAGAAALLVLATLIGAWWAHDELGWGGWWAWDPVENTTLAPLAALVASLHAASGSARRRWAQAAAGLVLLGVAAARSGLASSVHAFASNAGPAVFIGLAGLAVMGLTLRGVLVSDSATGVPERAEDREMPPEFGEPSGTGVPERAQDRDLPPEFESVGPAGGSMRRRVGLIVGAAALWVAMVVLTGELAAMYVGSGEEQAALDGGMVGRLMIPAGVTLLVGLSIYGWRAPRRTGVVLAHVGVLVFAVGVVASLGDWREFVVVPIDGQAQLRGESIGVGTPHTNADRLDLQRAEVSVTLGGSTYRPRIDRYPDLDRTRARPSRTLDWRGETEVVAAYIDDEQVGLEVRRHPGLGQVWGGGLLVVAGLAITAAAAIRRHLQERETLEILADPVAMAEIREAQAELAAGRGEVLTKEELLAMIEDR